MSGRIDIFVLDKTNNLIEEANILKPKSYEILNTTLKNNLKNLPEFFTLFYPSSNNKEIEIHNDEEYQLLKDTLFIRQREKIDLGKSIFDIAYDKLDESKRDILDEKYNCLICSKNIKHENPLFCYICQKIFHFKCLEDWSKKKQINKETLKCPYCNNEQPFEQWRKKLDYEENRINDAEIINQLKRDNEIKNEIFEKFREYKIRTNKIFTAIMNKFNEYNVLINNNVDNSIINCIKDLSDDNIDIQIDNISQIISNQFKMLDNYIENNGKINNNIKMNEIKNNKLTKIKLNLNEKDNNNLILIPGESSDNFNIIHADSNDSNDSNNISDNNLNDINKNIINNNAQKDKNEIELIYYSKYGGFATIFGVEFVNHNRNNIKLRINDSKNEIAIVNQFFLHKGENKVTLLIKNNLTDLSFMFHSCNTLKNINELKMLNTSNVIDFSYLFFGCSSLTHINSIRYWDVSQGKNFSYLFTGCNSLLNISPLSTWNVRNGTNFSYMFCRCLNLIDINPLRNWNVKNGKDFSYMFSGCFLLSDLKAIANWFIINGTNFDGIFSQCKSLMDLNDLKEWEKNPNFRNRQK